MTQGISSGLDRTVKAGRGPSLEGLLQTGAAINPGNSGGPLVDLAGRLVGIGTAAARAGTAENVGFAIAIDGARQIIAEIRAKPAAERAWLGISLDAVDSPAAAVQLGLPPETRGAAVVVLYAGSPAARAGVREADVLVAIGTAPVRTAEDASRALRGLSPGDETTLEIIDRSGPRRVRVKVVKRPATLPGG